MQYSKLLFTVMTMATLASALSPRALRKEPNTKKHIADEDATGLNDDDDIIAYANWQDTNPQE
ncbi:Uu.00g128110.m01.CDS01 [Anthostomella pinea]|uniref:Uu.00g128110.m01.CDS01 n=1 Tax=Anthostomella pinea TaxID=933095 RepID=A0AAI8YI31_9PEZI|nr:Uu.00g128110.m01.CDS01 [Anthostomella pinea]